MKKIYFFLLLFALILAGISEAQFIKVIAISNYELEVDIGKSVHVKNTITLKNLIDKPIVPGVGELRLQKRSPVRLLFLTVPFTEKARPLAVENVRAYTSNGKEIPVKVEEEGGYTKIVYEIWYPIEPGREFTFIVEYDSPELAERGILFKDISIPVGSDTEIERLSAKFTSDWKEVYAEPMPARLPAGGIAFYTAEFSPLPLPKAGFRWSLLLWSVVLILSAGALVYVWKKARR